jgi:hypothetical protein
MKLGKNIKLLQSKIKILECDWREIRGIQENTRFFCKIRKEYKITPIEDKNFRV